MEDYFEKGTGPYKDLAIATDNFSDNKRLGVQRIPEGIEPSRGHQESFQAGEKGVCMPLRCGSYISRLRHKNLVQLIGWCHGGKELLLLYELMTNGSPDRHLYGANTVVLPWSVRHEIVLGLGSALLYLHEEWEQCVLSCIGISSQATSCMLDASFSAKLGDFGLARLVEHGRVSLTTVLAGTMGYMDPE